MPHGRLSGQISRIHAQVRFKLRDYQIESVLKALETYPRSAIVLRQGLGKTIVGLALCSILREDGRIDSGLVICPKTVTHVWEEEISNLTRSMRVFVLNGNVRKKTSIVNEYKKARKLGEFPLLIGSYQSVWRLKKLFLRDAPHMVIADECQNLSSPGSKQSRFAHLLERRARFRLLLSGTPLDKPVAVFSQFKFLDKTIFGSSFGDFREEYCKMGGFFNKQIKGYKNLKRMKRKVAEVSYVELGDPVGLPSFTEQYRYVDLSSKTKSLYREMEKEFFLEFKRGEAVAPNTLSKISKLLQIGGGFVKIVNEDGEKIVQRLGTEKLDELASVMREIPRGVKVVVFARFRPEINAIVRRLREEGYMVTKITGSTENRPRVLKNFERNPDVDVCVSQVKVGGVGINELAVARFCIFYSTTHSYIDLDQARARLVRPRRGSDQTPITFIYLVANTKVERTLWESINAKEDLVHFVLGYVDHLRKA